MRFLIFLVVLLTLKLLGISPSEAGIVFIVGLIIGGVMAGLQDINELNRSK